MGYLKHLMPCALDCACKTGPCVSCCGTVSTVQCRTRSASKTKCGHSEFGTPSSPPKLYLTLSLAGTLTAKTVTDADCVECVSKIVYAYGGSCTFSRSTCSETNTGNEQTTVYADCSTPGTPTNSATCDVPDPFVGYTQSYSTTSHSVNGTACQSSGGGGHDYAGSASATLSDEYTTTDLANDVTAAVVAASWSSFATCTSASFWTQSGDDLTITKQQVTWRFNFASPASAGCKLVVDILKNGAAYATACFDLTAGQTLQDYEFLATEVGSFTPSNWRMIQGSC